VRSAGRRWTPAAGRLTLEVARSRHLEVGAQGVRTDEPHAVLGRPAGSHALLFGRPQPAAVQQPAPPVSLPLPRTETTLATRP
jgi:diguanylate cyclase